MHRTILCRKQFLFKVGLNRDPIRKVVGAILHRIICPQAGDTALLTAILWEKPCQTIFI